jgi:exodeoxyribonuclease V beta subunit
MPRREPLVVHSFSSLVAGATPGALSRDVRDPGTEPPAPGAGIFGFARGAAAGQCLHDVLEHVDLTAPRSDEAAALVAKTLSAHGLADPVAHPACDDPAAIVLQNLEDLAAARVGKDGPTVAALCGGAHRAEWQFTIPIASPDLQALAACFAMAECPLSRAYAQRLAELPAQRLAGFLTGFADLVAEHDGRYWLVDWKSNHLGNEHDDYDARALEQAMHEHDYVLQYHLYVLALHRHLAARLGDYDYDRHVAGVVYPFLRGVRPGTANGIFTARPSAELVAAIDGWARGLRPQEGRR